MVREAMHLKCSRCAAILESLHFEDEEGRDRGGNARAKTRYRCTDCAAVYHHTYWESFSGDYQQWWRIDGETATELSESEYPRWED